MPWLLKNIEVDAQIVTKELFDENLFNSTAKTFQIHKKYILSVIKSGVVLINQNLAHQRILYEDFLTKITVEDAVSQQLLFPIKLSFSQTEITLIKDIQVDLESAGFRFEPINNEHVIINGMPTLVKEGQVTAILEELLDAVKHDVPESSFSQLDIISKSLARSLAIKNGTKLNTREQEEILEQLFSWQRTQSFSFW